MPCMTCLAICRTPSYLKRMVVSTTPSKGRWNDVFAGIKQSGWAKGALTAVNGTGCSWMVFSEVSCCEQPIQLTHIGLRGGVVCFLAI